MTQYTKPTSPEDLKKNDWIVLTEFNMPEPAHSENVAFFRAPMVPDGIPILVKSVCLPFIWGERENQLINIYVPYFSFRKVSKDYVNCYLEGTQCRSNQAKR